MNSIHRITRRSLLHAACAAAAIVALGVQSEAVAAGYPEKDITIIVPYAPGASSDILAREYARLLGDKLGVTVVVQNIAGGAGTIGTVRVFGSDPDGYTLGYGHNSPLAIQPHKNPDLPYKGVDDFTTIGGIGAQSGTLSVNSASEWKTFADFVAAAKANPGKVSVAVGSAGNVKDMQLQMFEQAAGVELNVAPFSGGGAEAVAGVLGRIVDAVSVNASSVAGQIASGDIRPLAIFANSRQDTIQGFEVINAEDYPGLQLLQDDAGIIAPKGLPDDVLAILEAAHQEVMKDEGFVAFLERDVYIVNPTDSAGYRAQLQADFDNFGKLLVN